MENVNLKHNHIVYLKLSFGVLPHVSNNFNVNVKTKTQHVADVNINYFIARAAHNARKNNRDEHLENATL